MESLVKRYFWVINVAVLLLAVGPLWLPARTVSPSAASAARR